VFKKIFNVVSFALLCASIVLLLFGSSIAAEGTKVMTYENQAVRVEITVPEMAPEFLGWGGMILGAEEYANGNALMLAQHANEDMSVMVNAVWVRVGEKISIVAFAVFYENKPGAEVECYQDMGFVKAGTPSGVFVRVPLAEVVDMATLKGHLTKE
jgi:hypothetical protein